MAEFSHLDKDGFVQMVDISEIRLMPDKGLRKTFDEAIKYWKTQKEDMAAMPDFYNRFKKIINWYDEGGRKRKAAEAQLKSLQQDFRNGWVFSNTIFIPNISFVNMIHYFQTKKEKSSNYFSTRRRSYFGCRDGV